MKRRKSTSTGHENGSTTSRTKRQRRELSTTPGSRNLAGSASTPQEPDFDSASETERFVTEELGTWKTYREVGHVATPGPAYPRSAYAGWSPDATRLDEHVAISHLKRAHTAIHTSETPEYTYFVLDDFSFYRPRASAWHSLELASLERLSQGKYPEFCLDGYLSVGNERYYVQEVPFQALTIDGYGDPGLNDMADQLCVQTETAARRNVWYKLGKPSSVYKRFHDPFLWLAQFAKHFIDYLLDAANPVTLNHFRHRFYTTLCAQYRGSDFDAWIAVAKLKDFRTTVAANVGFLWKECHSLDSQDKDSRLCRHPLWQEIDPLNLKAILHQPNFELDTTVTPYAYECFRGMYFGHHLKVKQIPDSVLADCVRQKRNLKLTPAYVPPSNRADRSTTLLSPMSLRASLEPPETMQVSAGDVVRVRPDPSTRWGANSQAWYAYVKGVRPHADRTLLDVLWLYEPKDTTIGQAVYPFPNELFLSDNCSCRRDALDLDCVVDIVNVSWHTLDPYQEPGLFVRQKFRTVHEEDEYDFASLRKSDFDCRCANQIPFFEDCRSKYDTGDTVLVREWAPHLGKERLQPGQILDFDSGRRRIRIRKFERKSEQDPSSLARPNELVTTSQIVDRNSERVVRRCHIRYFTPEQIKAGDIVTPYDRDGSGDYFFISGDEDSTFNIARPLPDENGELVYNDDVPSVFPPISQGWDPRALPPKEKLTGMGIFCGGGTFDRGLEEGGSVKFRYAVDWNEHALHSYRANLLHPEDVKFFLGSVNDYLSRAMDDRVGDCIARIGDVQFISAGSPCPGFSTLQPNKLSEDSKQMASLVASVVSWVDFYAPKYLFLENVVAMTCGMGPQKNENVFSQVVGALVGLGYQVQQFLMDGWNHGSSQQRSRVFIVASAPGMKSLIRPAHSHAHPRVMRPSRALGTSSNGKRFGSRHVEDTPFRHVSAAEATADLPDVADSQPQLCPAYPDHRTATDETLNNRTRMAVVPVRPHGMGLAQARAVVRPGLPALLCGEPLDFFGRVNEIRRSKGSQMYARVHPERLFPTVTTRFTIGDGINGRAVHWQQHRVLTVMEARRAQGYLDHEVLVGTPSQQLKIVGNSVDRKVALVLGLALRESWMQTDLPDDQDSEMIKVAASQAASDLSLRNGQMEASSEEDGAQDEQAEYATPRSFSEDAVAGPSKQRSRSPIEDAAEEAEEENTPPATPRAPVTPFRSLGVDISSANVDNRTVKIMLQLTPEQIAEVKDVGFKAIKRILEERDRI